MPANITENWESEIVTPLKDLDEVHSFTVARTISENECVELHYHSGSAWIEIETKTAPDTWEGTFREVRWNPRRMNEHKIMSRLERKRILHRVAWKSKNSQGISGKRRYVKITN